MAGRLRHRWGGLGLRQKGVVIVAVPLLAFAVASGLFLYTVRSDARAERWVHHSEDAERQIAIVKAQLLRYDGDAGSDLLVGDTATTRQAAAALANSLTDLGSLVSDNAAQSARVSSLRRALAAVPPLPGGSRPVPTAVADSWIAQEKAVTTAASGQLDSMDAVEAHLLSQRRGVAQDWRTLSEIFVAVLFALGVLGGLAGIWLFPRGLARRVGALECELDTELAGLDVERFIPSFEGGVDELDRLAARVRGTLNALAERGAELKRASAYLENILSVGPVVVLRLAGDRSVSYVSPNCARVLGVVRDDAAALDFWAEAIAPEEVDRFNGAVRKLFEPDAPAVVDFEGKFNVGGRERYLSSLVTRETLGGEDDGVLVYLLDVTERHEAEREVAERQRELSAITAASPDIIVVFNSELRIAFVSEATTSVTGVRSTDRVGRALGDTVHKEDRRLLTDAVRSVISGAAEDFTVRVRVKHVSGRYLVLEGHGRPLLGSDGAPVAAVAVFRDISERIALEAELVEARDAATAASKAKSEFLSRMSHELRTPLNVVLGFAQLLQMEPMPEEQQGWVDQVLRAGRHLLDLINEVLDIARIESGALALSPEAVSLRDVVGETVEQLRPIAANNEILVDFLVEGDDLYAQADRQRLKQVLLNLLANAVKYNRPRGSVLVTCTASGPAHIEIKVSDTGVGIAAEHLERLFVPFDRLGAENSAIEGTGVGLPLSLRLVQAMDGALSVESSRGEGSSFTVTLPRLDSPAEQIAEDSLLEAELDLDFDESLGPQGTLLYIEDNLPNLQLMQRIISRRPGIRLLHAFHGRMGLDLARTGHADVVLLDLHLPDMSGMDVLGQLRADPTTAGVPVYVVSADATAGQVVRLREAGAAGYLTKPLDIHRVLALFDEVFERQVPAAEGD